MAILGVGTQILITGGDWDTQSYPYHSVVEAYSFGPVTDDREEVEVTHYQSFQVGTTQGWREYIPGLRTDAEIEFEANYTGDEFKKWHVAKEQSTELTIQVVYPDFYCHSFGATVKGVDLTVPVDDRMTYTVSLTVTTALSVYASLTPLYSQITGVSSGGSTGTITFNDSVNSIINSARQIEYLLAHEPAGQALHIQVAGVSGSHEVASINTSTGLLTITGSTWGASPGTSTYTLTYE